MPNNYKEAYQAIEKAIKKWTDQGIRIDKLLRRILYAKIKRGEIPPDTTLLKDNE